MRRLIITTSTLLALLAGWESPALAITEPEAIPYKQAVSTPAAKVPDQPIIQIAILLDTSGSMEGLINQARTRIWDVVNDMTKARKNGKTPRFEVALYQYGSDLLPSSEGFLRCVQPFTTDLDMISERLFALRITGSAEFCGQVADSALRQLSWDSTPASAPLAALPLRVVIIAGNEEFTQGPVDYHPVMTAAKQHGVFVNTIYCGPYSEGEKTGWLNAAYLAGGSYNSIDQDKNVAYVPAPQDPGLLKLNEELNTTYIAYGSTGREYQARQTMQDSVNLAASPAGAASRVASKGSEYYCNSHWDLIDACKTNTVELSKVATVDLPEIMRPMTLPEREAYVAKLKAKRDAINIKIAELSRDREKFLADYRAKCGATLDTAITRAIREQANKTGFTFAAD